MADEVRLIDTELLTTNIAQIAKNCARSDAQKALIGRILFMIENMPTIEAKSCTFCVYNPPSSGDGKPCTACPAHKRSDE